jgi:hypothetical protein
MLAEARRGRLPRPAPVARREQEHTEAFQARQRMTQQETAATDSSASGETLNRRSRFGNEAQFGGFAFVSWGYRPLLAHARRPRSLVIGGPLAEVDAWLAPFREQWERRFDRLESVLGARASSKRRTDDSKTEKHTQKRTRTKRTKS